MLESEGCLPMTEFVGAGLLVQVRRDGTKSTFLNGNLFDARKDRPVGLCPNFTISCEIDIFRLFAL